MATKWPIECNFDQCKKPITQTDDNVVVTVHNSGVVSEQKRFCSLCCMGKWGEYRENFPLPKRIVKIRLPR